MRCSARTTCSGTSTASTAANPHGRGSRRSRPRARIPIRLYGTAAADHVPGDPRTARPPVPARAAHAGAPLRLRRRQQIAGQGTRRCNGVGGARGSSPASRAGHYEVTPRYRPLRRRRSAPPPMLHPVDPLLQWYPERWWPAEADDGATTTRAQPDLAARNPASRSARMSSIDSRPTDRRTSSGRTPGRELLVAGELAVGGRRRVDGQAAHVADVGQVAVQLEALDELLAGLACRPGSRTR